MGEKRRPTVLLLAALILAACFFLAPAILAGGDFGPLTDGRLVESAFRTQLVASWQSAGQGMTPELVHLIDYWRRYHAVKIVIAAGLLAVLVALGFSCRRRPIALSVGLGAVGLFALMLVVVNIQATAAPFTALLQALPRPDRSTTAAVYQEIAQALADHRSPPVLDAMIDSFGRYHATMAAETTVLAWGLVAMSAWAWRRRPPARARGTVAALLAAGLVAIAGASAITSADATDALRPYFSGAAG